MADQLNSFVLTKNQEEHFSYFAGEKKYAVKQKETQTKERKTVILGYSTPDIILDLHITLYLCIMLYIHAILYVYNGGLFELQLRINWH